jgi:hypothetical protein
LRQCLKASCARTITDDLDGQIEPFCGEDSRGLNQHLKPFLGYETAGSDNADRRMRGKGGRRPLRRDGHPENGDVLRRSFQNPRNLRLQSFRDRTHHGGPAKNGTRQHSQTHAARQMQVGAVNRDHQWHADKPRRKQPCEARRHPPMRMKNVRPEAPRSCHRSACESCDEPG